MGYEDPYFDENMYYVGLSGILQAIAQAARKDKEDIRRSYVSVFGPDVGEWLSQVKVSRRDPRARLLAWTLMRAAIKDNLRGRWDGKFRVTPDALALMLELSQEYTFETYNLPEKLPLTQRILRSLRVER